MRCLLPVLVGLAAVSSAAATQGVVTLTDSNFEAETASGLWLLEFYAPWCGHCKALAPVLAEAAPKVAPKMRIGAIDATANLLLKQKYDVNGYPTLKYRRGGGQLKDFHGGRDVAGLSAWADRMTGAPVHTLSTEGELATFSEKDTVVFVLGEGQGKSKALGKLFETVAKDLQASIYFGKVTSADVLKDMKDPATGKPPTAGPWVARVEKGSSDIYEFYYGTEEGGSTAKALQTWVTDNKHATLNDLGSNNFRDIAHSGRLLVIAAIDPDDKTKTPAVMETMKKLAHRRTSPLSSEARARFNFGIMDGVKWSKFVEQFNVHTVPYYFVLDAPNSKFYEDPKVDEADELETYLTDVAAGKVQAQREGMWGLPGRALKLANQYAPWSYLFVAANALVLGYVLYCICTGCCCGDDDDEFEEEDDKED